MNNTLVSETLAVAMAVGGKAPLATDTEMRFRDGGENEYNWIEWDEVTL